MDLNEALEIIKTYRAAKCELNATESNLLIAISVRRAADATPGIMDLADDLATLASMRDEEARLGRNGALLYIFAAYIALVEKGYFVCDDMMLR